MRLLQINVEGESVFTRDLLPGKDQIPPYAILSHTWDNDHDNEVTYKDIRKQRGPSKSGYRKVVFCADRAKHDGLEHFWIDTCCIDKTNAAELTESINSMYRWYQNAQKCYVYLADVSYICSEPGESDKSRWKSDFRKSRWFTRGWTLQELIAPTVVEFFSTEGQLLGNRTSLERTIHEITHIPLLVLQGTSLSQFDNQTRISWSRGRVTSKGEDKAYCLLGILGVTMPSNYGEGEEGAFKRLNRVISINQAGIAEDAQLEANIDQCLSELRLSDPRDDKSRIESTKGGLLEDSFRWILEHQDFRQWRCEQDSSLLWIKGDPGKGKTMLLCGIADELTRPSTNQCLVSYFFCQATDRNMNNATAILRGLIYMLIRQHRPLVKHLYNEWKLAGSRLFEDVNAWAALTRILTLMLQDCQHIEVVFIVDALDECLEDLPRLLRFIAQQSQAGEVKWLVSSRNWPQIEGLLGTASRKVRLSLELNEASISTAVGVYIRHKANNLRLSKGIDDLTHNQIINYMNSNAGHTFLWVALVYQRLEDDRLRARHILKELARYPPGLDALYQRMLDSISTSIDAVLCYEILSTVSVTYGPVSLAELRGLIESDCFNNIIELREVVESCGSFLTIRNNVIYFVHQSAKEFLTTKAVEHIFLRGSIPAKHRSLSETSLKLLSKSLQRDPYHLSNPGISVLDINRPLPDPLAPIRYSCVFWMNHMVDGGFYGDWQTWKDTVEAIRAFFEQQYLYWLETLGLLGATTAGMLSLTKLLHSVNGHDELKTLEALIYDAMRFIKYNGVLIAEYPLQAYAAALVFSPMNSLMRKRFQHEEPEWMALKPCVKMRWSAHLQKLEGHTGDVSSVAFSHDSRFVASGSTDHTVRIWNTESGKARQVLRGHTGSVNSVAFSHDSRLVAASSTVDRMVRIWETETGELWKALGNHMGSVYSVAFSHNSRLLVSASADFTVRIWDIGTSKALLVLSDPIGNAFSAAFSHDSRLVASGSGDHAVRIWDTETGEVRQVLEGHQNYVFSVAFSHDSRLMASASMDQTIRVWDTESGESRQMLRGHTGSVNSVAFSHDDRLVVSASSDRTVRIWDAETGEARQVFEGHTNSITSAVFSHDSRLVASGSGSELGLGSGSGDHAVWIWDTEMVETRQILEGHTGLVFLLALSHDSQLVASVSVSSLRLGSTNHSVGIWDTETGKVRQLLKGHTNSVNSVAFSHDNRLLVSGSEDRTVRVWDIETGEARQVLEGHLGSVDTIAFSYDSRFIASASRLSSSEHTVRLWEIETGVVRQVRKSHTRYISSIAFSHDSRLVALGDQTVEIWDAETGEVRQVVGGHTGPVISMAFSNNNRLVASASGDHTVRIWDTETGEARQVLEVTDYVHQLRFDHDDVWLITDLGAFSVVAQNEGISAQPHYSMMHALTTKDVPESTNQTVYYGISQDRRWITAGGKNILWLPTEYRPTKFRHDASATSGDVVAIGCSSGRVLIIRAKSQ